MKDDIDESFISGHEDGEGHGYKLADNVIEFIESWSRLGFVVCEDAQFLPFTTNPISDINAVRGFRAWLGLDAPTGIERKYKPTPSL
ncbi:hypothetical protein [Cytobacillus sp. IB215665]|uniref:hypothetical protein n=1 Tax=Cytobacillus sp. IB215665 TaxID=3097357 RepID=UPI002A1529CF|nr:hypothetical protein [Cytobacillus sp. IB215665]MDX8366112.1 hypothetical protein [Cytobacillus sp. IB215665]